MSTTLIEDIAAVKVAATDAFAEHGPALASPDLPASVVERFAAFREHVTALEHAGDQLAQDYAELQTKRDLVPPAGFHRLRDEAVAEARTKADGAQRGARQELAALKAALLDAATPKVESSRESLAREEFAAAMNVPTGTPELKLAAVVEHGSREAAAVAFTPFGRTILAASGVEGPEADEALTMARGIVTSTAAVKGETAAERAAGAALQHVDSLDAAIVAHEVYSTTVLDHVSGE